jgi:hypothetical protein
MAWTTTRALSTWRRVRQAGRQSLFLSNKLMGRWKEREGDWQGMNLKGV